MSKLPQTLLNHPRPGAVDSRNDGRVFITWDQVEAFVSHIVNMYDGNHIPFTGVYGLPRGGLVLAVMISHRLHIPLLQAPAKGCLIVDDICDSGESLVHYIKNSSKSEAAKQFTVATMVYRPGAAVCPDNYLYEKVDEWIVFPWEDKTTEV